MGVSSRVRTLTTLDKTSVGTLDKNLMRQKYAQEILDQEVPRP
jgi:hypothetical protein